MWILFYPIFWLVVTTLLLRIFAPENLVQNVDLFQIIMAYLFFSLRGLIVSVNTAITVRKITLNSVAPLLTGLRIKPTAAWWETLGQIPEIIPV